MRVVVVAFLLACLSVQVPAYAQDAVKPQVADIKTQAQAQAYVASQRDAGLARSLGVDTASSARQYVEGLHGLDEASYTLSTQVQEGSSHIYRVTVAADVKGYLEIERVFEVLVDASSGKVVGERGALR